MKEHFCPAEQSTITYQGKCNWCGESEGSMTQEVLKLAEDYAKNRANYHIESLYGRSESYTATIKKAMLKAHQALKEALAQTQEPLAWTCLIDSADFSKNTITIVMQCDDYKVSAGTHWLSTAPPQRTWVGLTDEEQQELYDQWQGDGWGSFYQAIEAKLKEKNNGV